MEQKVKTEECIELKNIKYKTMLIGGGAMREVKTCHDDMNSLDKFLEEDKIHNKNEPWSKLDKTIKTQKLMTFAEKYTVDHMLSEEEQTGLIVFLKDCLDRKRLHRVKDVEYDKTRGEISSVPALAFNKSTGHFTLRNVDKRVSTLRSLPPKKTKATRGTVKNTKESGADSDSDAEVEDQGISKKRVEKS
jgi:hypothetical protein